MGPSTLAPPIYCLPLELAVRAARPGSVLVESGRKTPALWTGQGHGGGGGGKRAGMLPLLDLPHSVITESAESSRKNLEQWRRRYFLPQCFSSVFAYRFSRRGVPCDVVVSA